jgi:hypothetical protein
MNAAQQAILERWDKFLGSIEQRNASIIEEARQGVAAMSEGGSPDTAAIDRALHAIGMRLQTLRGKIMDTWSAQVMDKFTALDIPGFEDVGLDRAESLGLLLEERWEDFRTRTVADVYRSMHPAAAAALALPAQCATCKAPIEPESRIRTVSATCGSCNAVNQVVPHADIRAYQPAAHAYAEEASMPIRIAIQRHRQAADRRSRHAGYAPEPIASLEEWAALELQYWQKYAEVQAAQGDHGPNHVAELVKSRMDAFEEYSVKTDQRWRRARGL